MTRATLTLLLALAAPSVHAQGLAEPAPDAQPPGAPQGPGVRGVTLPRGAVLEEVSGVVREIDRKEHRLSVESNGAPVRLSLDRNTMVYTAAGLGTVLDLVPGAQVRAGRNAEFLAYWIQVRAPARKEEAPPSTPAQGTGPAGGAAAAASEAGAAPGGPPGPGAPGAGTPGGATPGPSAVPGR
jgi:hypothetical protein